MKYYIMHKSKYTGFVEVLMTKRTGGSTERWCDRTYLANHPDRVWQFTKAGADGVVARLRSSGRSGEFFLVPVEAQT